ncbi:PREDICTED: uncharacterized protein LOC109242125 [Nicotiana attenuata]|uniref:uncharacterized protein LOC109242125 n=1 Tax=Nicotiana attenuata TaxID=49451 RepID=UPI0009051C6E|nr:PREDICTED: uncharacterized protein LOC109242125 [Nicotiana attenuata]
MGTNSQTTDTLISSPPVPTASVSAGSSGIGLVDSAHPYYLHPSDYPRMNPVSSVFDGRGYGGWRRAVVIALSAKNKLGFIDGTLVVPDADSGLQRAWARCNDMVLSWLLNSLSKEIAESVLYSQSAKDPWHDLEDRFGQASGAKLFQLQKELSAVVQGESGSFMVTNQAAGKKFGDSKGQKGSYDAKKNSGICAYCKKLGHSIDKCYRVHGFPADFKFTKPRKF